MASSGGENFKGSVKKINVVLDIDETLATDLIEENPLEFLGEVEKICGNSGRYVWALRRHYLHHGVAELIVALTAISNVDLFFFSSDEAGRNIPFVKELLLKAKGEKYFETSNQEKRIFSKHHTQTLKELLEKMDISHIQPEQNIYRVGGRKKNLYSMGIDQEEMLNTVIGDDYPGIAFKGQEKNLILMFPGEPKYLKIANEWKGSEEDYMKSDAFKSLNHIFYLAGLLIPAIQKVNQDPCNFTLTEVLGDLQFKKDSDGKVHPCYAELHQDINIYQAGLTLLKKCNPNIDFLLPHNLQKQLNLIYSPQKTTKAMENFGLKLSSGLITNHSLAKNDPQENDGQQLKPRH